MNTIALVLYPMRKFFLLLLTVAGVFQPAISQTTSIDLRSQWLTYKDGAYVPRESVAPTNSIYFSFDAAKFPNGQLNLQSSRNYFLFLNGKLSGEYSGIRTINLDSITSRYGTSQFMACIFQDGINPRELRTEITSQNLVAAASPPLVLRPADFFKDFVIATGLLIIIFFLVISQLNPKLASDYFSILKIFSPREADDAQSNARLTSSNNFQFYIGCSLLVAFYLMIILYNLPAEYALPLKFQATGFWSVMWQWMRMAMLVMVVFLLKIVVVFMLTRLFNMRGLARVHFFNWIRLLLIVFGAVTIIAFSYYILRGQSETVFVVFLSLIIATLIAWIFIVFMKLNGKTEHSMFHLFSYICATELIPLLITIKVLFQ